MRNRVRIGQRFFIEYRVKQFVEFLRITAFQSGFLIDITLVKHVGRDLYHGGSGTFTATRLQQPKFAVLNGKLEVLHIFEIIFEFLLRFDQLSGTFGHDFLERGVFGRPFLFADALHLGPSVGALEGNLLRSTHAGYHIFALSIDKILAVKQVFARGGVAGESYAGGGSITHVAVYHRLHIHRRAPFFGEIVHLTIENGPVVHPTVEYGTYGAP